MLSRVYRLPLKNEPFKGHKTSARLLSLVYAPNKLNHSRAAVIVSKKVVKKAVDRNKLKRRLLHAIKPYLDQSPHLDYLLLPKAAVTNQPFSQIENEVHSLVQKAQTRSEKEAI